MTHTWINNRLSSILVGGLILLLLFLAGCGSSTSNTATSMGTINNTARSASQHRTMDQSQLQRGTGTGTSGTTQTGTTTTDTQPQYLAKTLTVRMQINDTRKAADEILTWMTTSDPRTVSAGTNYNQVANDQYDISLTFSVPAASYPKAYSYLRDYSSNHKGHLTAFTETVQDVTGDFVDTQSRLKNLRSEQARLQDLMSHAQALSDVITIDQRLTDVEEKIEEDEAHLNALNSQVTFYTVTLELQPPDSTTPTIDSGWSIGQVLSSAFAASLGFGQSLLTFILWLLAFSIYIIPVLAIVWGVRRWQARRPRALPRPSEQESTPPANA